MPPSTRDDFGTSIPQSGNDQGGGSIYNDGSQSLASGGVYLAPEDAQEVSRLNQQYADFGKYGDAIGLWVARGRYAAKGWFTFDTEPGFGLPISDHWDKFAKEDNASSSAQHEQVKEIISQWAAQPGWFPGWASSSLSNGGCFVAGTLVQTPDGARPIESIKVGDVVAARDETTGETTFKPVLQLIHHENQEIVNLTLADEHGQQETIQATPEHPFHVHDRGWIGAGQLSMGDQVDQLDSGRGSLHVLQVHYDARRQATYNFEVADDHTYFVGLLGAWVHNVCPPAANPGGEKRLDRRMPNPDEVEASINGRQNGDYEDGSAWGVAPTQIRLDPKLGFPQGTNVKVRDIERFLLNHGFEKVRGPGIGAASSHSIWKLGATGNSLTVPEPSQGAGTLTPGTLSEIKRDIATILGGGH